MIKDDLQNTIVCVNVLNEYRFLYVTRLCEENNICCTYKMNIIVKIAGGAGV